VRITQSVLRKFEMRINMRIAQLKGAAMQTPLRNMRVKKELKITDVANAVSCDPGYLSRVERGVHTASPELAEKLSRFYRGEITELQILYPKRYERAGDNQPPIVQPSL
jgi:transcriptional regulator with XRE-family HTH domain